jgi:hypothetical protein
MKLVVGRSLKYPSLVKLKHVGSVVSGRANGEVPHSLWDFAHFCPQHLLDHLRLAASTRNGPPLFLSWLKNGKVVGVADEHTPEEIHS